MTRRKSTRIFAGMLGAAVLMGTNLCAYAEDTAVVEAENDKGEAVTLTLGVWADDETKRLEAAFEGMEEEIGIKIEFLKYPSDSDFWDNIPAQIAAGTAPDIISCTNEHYLQYIEQGLFRLRGYQPGRPLGKRDGCMENRRCGLWNSVCAESGGVHCK